MTHEDIKVLTDLLFVLEDSEGEVTNKLQEIFNQNAILPNEYFMKVKGIIKLEYQDHSKYYDDRYTKFRPVIEVHYGGEVFSFTFNRQNTSIIYDVNSSAGVGEDVNSERVYENLIQYDPSRRRGYGNRPKYRYNERPDVQKNLLEDYLTAVLVE